MSIVNHAKEIADLIKKYNDQDLYEKIVTLREEILVLREENLQLKEERRSLSEQEDISSRLVRKGNCYFFKDDAEYKEPYCLACWDADRKLVSLIIDRKRTRSEIICNVCAARKK